MIQQSNSIRIYVVDDHAMVHKGLLAVLKSVPDLHCVGWSKTGQEALEQLKEHECDVLLLDFVLPDITGLQVLHRLATQSSQPRVILYSMYPESSHALRMLDAGAHAFLCKSAPTEELLECIRQVARKGQYLTEHQKELLLLEGPKRNPIAHQQLSARESEIFTLLTSGKTPSEISVALNIAHSTVSTHIRNIKEKLKLSTVADMVRYTYEHNLNV